MTGGAGVERDLAVVACAISAGVHAALVPAHLDEGTAAGAAFAGAAVILAALAVALTHSDAPLVAAGAAVVFTGLLAAYAVAITTGLPGVHPDPEPVDGLALFTKGVETLGLVAAAGLLRAARPAAARPIPLPLTGLIIAFTVLTTLAASTDHMAH